MLGEKSTIPFLGSQFNSFMPVFVILTSAGVIWRELKVTQFKRRREGNGDIEVRVERNSEW